MNSRLRSTLQAGGYTEESLAKELGRSAKTVQRWVTTGRTPHRTTAYEVAKKLNVPAEWLWPDLARDDTGDSSSELVALYPHRANTPKNLWLDLLVSARSNLDLFANASLFLPEENPEAIDIVKHKASNGTQVRILMGDPDSEAAKLRGREERLFDALPARIKMALAYYRPLLDHENIEFRLHETALYNSIFRFDDQMLVNQHIYGTYGYMAPIMHLRRTEHGDLFNTYLRSFDLVWNEESKPYEPNEPRF